MPIYEYTCSDCYTAFETLVFSADEPVECPKCESNEVVKQISVPAAPRVKSLPVGCGTQGPPCSPTCCRL